MIASFSTRAWRGACAAVTLLASLSAAAADRAVFQVTENDEARWNLVLNNVRNLQRGSEPDAEVEIVAFGPGITLLKAGSPIAARITEAVGNKVKVVACKNTMAGARLTEADMLPDIGYVPSGVVEVMRKQQQGYAYIRP
jgi:intracellular sulfur oxidation DsrE/DsrF family protein